MCCSLQERQKKTLTPNWDEDKWLLVQEPKTQAMRLQCFDHDALNVKVCTTPAPLEATAACITPYYSHLSALLQVTSKPVSVAFLGTSTLRADLVLMLWCTEQHLRILTMYFNDQDAPSHDSDACCRRW